MMYLTYAEYQEMGGTLDVTAFTDLEYAARMYIDWYTFSRLKKEDYIPDEVKECMYHMIRLIQQQMDAQGVPYGESTSNNVNYGIASQSNDGVSISYNTLSARDVIDTVSDQLNKKIKQSLDGVRDSLGHRLLYRGLYPDE